MRIVDIRIHAFEGAGMRPVVVELMTSDGLSGYGEAGVAYGCGASAAIGMIRDMAPMIVGRDASRIRALWQDLHDHSFWTKAGGTISFAALSAVEIALWDIAGKAAGRPVADLFGGRLHETIPVYANGWNHRFDDVTGWARAAERPLADGYTALKAYPFAHELADGSFRHPSRRTLDDALFRRALDRVRELRRVVGPNVTLMLDLSGGLVRDQLGRFLDACADLDIAWIEEPVAPTDLPGLRFVAERTRIPIAVGERIHGRAGFASALDTGCVDIVMPDVATCGGLFEGIAIVAMAETRNARVSPHNCAGPVCGAASLALAAAVTAPMALEIYPYFAEAEDWPHLVENPIEDRIRGGTITVSDDPGLGLIVDTARLRQGLVWSHRG